jgi:hypothetical protein
MAAPSGLVSNPSDIDRAVMASNTGVTATEIRAKIADAELARVRLASSPMLWGDSVMKHMVPEQLSMSDIYKTALATGSAMEQHAAKRYVEPSKTLRFTPIKNGYLINNGNDQYYCEDLDKIAATVVSLLAAHMLELEP